MPTPKSLASIRMSPWQSCDMILVHFDGLSVFLNKDRLSSSSACLPGLQGGHPGLQGCHCGHQACHCGCQLSGRRYVRVKVRLSDVSVQLICQVHVFKGLPVLNDILDFMSVHVVILASCILEFWKNVLKSSLGSLELPGTDLLLYSGVPNMMKAF